MNIGAEMVKELLKLTVGLMIMTAMIVAASFFINEIFGTITSFFAAFVWLIIAPALAGRMVAAIVIYFRNRNGL